MRVEGSGDGCPEPQKDIGTGGSKGFRSILSNVGIVRLIGSIGIRSRGNGLAALSLGIVTMRGSIIIGLIAMASNVIGSILIGSTVRISLAVRSARGSAASLGPGAGSASDAWDAGAGDASIPTVGLATSSGVVRASCAGACGAATSPATSANA